MIYIFVRKPGNCKVLEFSVVNKRQFVSKV